MSSDGFIAAHIVSVIIIYKDGKSARDCICRTCAGLWFLEINYYMVLFQCHPMADKTVQLTGQASAVFDVFSMCGDNYYTKNIIFYKWCYCYACR